MSKARNAITMPLRPGRSFSGKQFKIGSKVRSTTDGAIGEIIELGKVAGEPGAYVRWEPDHQRYWARLSLLRVVPT
jgi:hypothetical protein